MVKKRRFLLWVKSYVKFSQKNRIFQRIASESKEKFSISDEKSYGRKKKREKFSVVAEMKSFFLVDNYEG